MWQLDNLRDLANSLKGQAAPPAHQHSHLGIAGSALGGGAVLPGGISSYPPNFPPYPTWDDHTTARIKELMEAKQADMKRIIMHVAVEQIDNGLLLRISGSGPDIVVFAPDAAKLGELLTAHIVKAKLHGE